MSDLAVSKCAQPAPATPPPPRGSLSFIETQFPVSKLSRESYEERKASYLKYQRIEKIGWESCERVLASSAKLAALKQGW